MMVNNETILVRRFMNIEKMEVNLVLRVKLSKLWLFQTLKEVVLMIKRVERKKPSQWDLVIYKTEKQNWEKFMKKKCHLLGNVV